MIFARIKGNMIHLLVSWSHTLGWFKPRVQAGRESEHRCGSLSFVLDDMTSWVKAKKKPMQIDPSFFAAVKEVELCPCQFSEHYDASKDPTYNPAEEGSDSGDEVSSGASDDDISEEEMAGLEANDVQDAAAAESDDDVLLLDEDGSGAGSDDEDDDM